MIAETIADINVVKITMDNQIYIKKNLISIKNMMNKRKKVLEYPIYWVARKVIAEITHRWHSWYL